jgi:hypothetical protein
MKGVFKKMESKIVMILGGYGGAGFNISQLLLQETSLDLTLAGRSYTKAITVAEDLNAKFRKFTKPPYTTTLSMEAQGKVDHHKEKIEIIISHKNGYQATAIPVVAGILQLLDGSIKDPGVIIMGHGVDPDRHLKDIKRMGMSVRITQSRMEGK